MIPFISIERRTYTELGQPIPLHQGAPGKVLPAFLSPAAREAILVAPLAAATAPQALVAGVPGRIVRDVTDKECALIDRIIASYLQKSKLHRQAVEVGGR